MLQRLKSNPTLKNVLAMLSSSSVSQIIPFISAPILTRIYNPTEFGIFEVYYSLMNIIVIIPNLRLENGVLIDKSESKAVQLFIGCFFSNIACLIIGLVSIFFLSGILLDFYSIETETTSWMYMIPVGMFLSSLYNLLTQWTVRFGKFKPLAVNRIILSISNAAIQIGFGYMYLSYRGLIYGNIISYFLAVLLMTVTCLRFSKHISFRPNWSEMKSAVRDYKDFIFYSLPGDFVNSFSRQLPTLMIGRFFSPLILGYYGMARRIVGLPLGFVSSALRDVFKKEATDEYNKTGGIVKTFNTTFFVLLGFGTLLIGGLYTLGDSVIIWFLGPKWVDSLAIIKILSILFVIRFIAGTLNFVFFLKNKQRVDLFFQLALLGTVYFSFVISNYFNLEAIPTLIVYTASIGLYSLINLKVSHGYAQIPKA